MQKEEVRIDKWLWATRLFKSRTIAVDACRKGRILMKGKSVKASRMIRLGDIITVKRPPVEYSYEVIGLIERRVGAKLVPNYLKDVTPKEQLSILESIKFSGFVDRARGMGRPTKKDRRVLEDFIEDSDYEFDSDDY